MEKTPVARHVITLPGGAIEGSIVGGVVRYLDIPYAAPPVDRLRFEPPQPVTGWEGLRATSATHCSAPQRVGSVPGVDLASLLGPAWTPCDDYLTLNVWQPPVSTAGMPVMVYVHGGGFVSGSKDAPVHDGTSFARDGVVCVSINYRLGIEGFLPIPGIATNLGLRDIIAALEWVRNHAELFGGDPSNVTVFGESAGAMAVADLMVSPLATGLFRRAIIQSGHGAMTRSVAVAQRLVNWLATHLDIEPSREGFASVPLDRLLDAVEAVSQPDAGLDLRDRNGHEPVFGISRFVPVHGDDVLPLEPLTALRAGAGAGIDLLIGTNAEEMNLYLAPSNLFETATAELALAVLKPYHPEPGEVLHAYGLDAGRQAGAVLADALSDLVFRWPARRFAEEHQGRTHVYEFEWKSTAFDGRLGAAHAVEVPFVFDTLRCAIGPEGLLGETAPQDVADRVHAMWVAFASDGKLPWPQFNTDRRAVHHLAADHTIDEPPMAAARLLP